MNDRSSSEVSDCGAKRGFGGKTNFYERLSRVFSAGLKTSAKRNQLVWLKPDFKVLYLGVGAAEDAFLAARQGVRLTCVNISQAMLEQVDSKLEGSGLSAELLCQNAMDHDRFEYYDAVVCNFFLNCFQENECIQMLHHASLLIRPKGLLLIADLAAPHGSWWQRTMTVVYLKTGMVFFWLIGMVTLHAIYDYRQYFPSAGLELVESTQHRLSPFGPVVYENLVARRIA